MTDARPLQIVLVIALVMAIAGLAVGWLGLGAIVVLGAIAVSRPRRITYFWQAVRTQRTQRHRLKLLMAQPRDGVRKSRGRCWRR